MPEMNWVNIGKPLGNYQPEYDEYIVNGASYSNC